jgi:hypothetical protein
MAATNWQLFGDEMRARYCEAYTEALLHPSQHSGIQENRKTKESTVKALSNTRALPTVGSAAETPV